VATSTLRVARRRQSRRRHRRRRHVLLRHGGGDHPDHGSSSTKLAARLPHVAESPGRHRGSGGLPVKVRRLLSCVGAPSGSSFYDLSAANDDPYDGRASATWVVAERCPAVLMLLSTAMLHLCFVCRLKLPMSASRVADFLIARCTLAYVMHSSMQTAVSNQT